MHKNIINIRVYYNSKDIIALHTYFQFYSVNELNTLPEFTKLSLLTASNNIYTIQKYLSAEGKESVIEVLESESS